MVRKASQFPLKLDPQSNDFVFGLDAGNPDQFIRIAIATLTSQGIDFDAISTAESINFEDFVLGVTFTVPDVLIKIPISLLPSSSLSFTPEDIANKSTDLTTPDDTKYPTTQAIVNALSSYVTSTALANALSSYITSTALANALSSYITSTALASALTGKQNSLGYTPENVSNKAVTLSSPNDTKYPTTKAVSDAIASLSAGNAQLQDFTFTIATLGAGATATGSIAMPQVFEVVSLKSVIATTSTGQAVRVRLYRTTSARTADASRPSDPPGNQLLGHHDCICDLLVLTTDAGGLRLPEVRPDGTLRDSNAYYAITNNGSTASIEITFKLLHWGL